MSATVELQDDGSVAHDLEGGVKLIVRCIHSDEKDGTWLVLATEHDAVEVRVSPKGHRMTSWGSTLKPWKWEDNDD